MNNQEFLIRPEQRSDHRAVEELTRQAFWNVYKPGCDEHYFVHIMRSHPDFIPELDFVITHGSTVVANIMYLKSWLEDEAGTRREILSFGPISVHPAFQRRGLGKLLISHSCEAAQKLGYDTVVIFGNPENYVCSGFKSCKRFNVCLEGGRFPSALLVRELKEGALDGRRYIYRESGCAAMIEAEKAEAFDRSFPPMEKAWMPSQEKFYIYSHSAIG
ncbi:MAG: N-acetyltransferase [Oscillospiraceae bacterium]|nr:N-acetyltransferase [Oscillospiraceae bacterium]